jgi:MoxR-like ATPase
LLRPVTCGSREEIDALILAWAARRPLLVRGEAGSGKSQIARAGAWILGEQEPLIEVIEPRFEARDLLYTEDLVERLADAQLEQAIGRVAQPAETVMLAEGFIVAGSKEATWNAWNTGVAEPAFDRTNKRYVKQGALWKAIDSARETGRRPVLLVDEIDKADADVPNALLEVLGNRSFKVAPLQNHVVNAGEGRLPLVIVTTNEERELPPAFVRRCVVLNLNPPADDAAFLDWLIQRGRVHHHLRVAEAVQRHAAEQVLADRKEALASGCSPVGLAEYIDH